MNRIGCIRVSEKHSVLKCYRQRRGMLRMDMWLRTGYEIHKLVSELSSACICKGLLMPRKLSGANGWEGISFKYETFWDL